MTKRRWLWAALAVVLLVGARPAYRAFGFFKEARFWSVEMGRGEGKLQVGDTAPDFELRHKKSEETLRLSSFRGDRPVALIFGSYT